MKKKTLLASALMGLMLCAPGVNVVAQTGSDYAASASDKLFTFDKFNEEVMLNLFYEAQQKGRKYPTLEEFAAKGILVNDLEFFRSHVPQRAVIKEQTTQLNPALNPDRNLWFNIPTGMAKGIGGFPSTNYGDDTFSMWNYTKLFGNWNHGLFSAPGVWTDAAHKNGTDIPCGIKFFDTTGGRGQGAGSYINLIVQTDESGQYKYVKPLINCLEYFGWDGINYNFEASGYDDVNVMGFHKALYKEAEARGFNNFFIGLYTNTSNLTAYNVGKLTGSDAEKISTLMLNYSGNDFAIYTANSSQAAAINAGRSLSDIYLSAWIVTMNRNFPALANNQLSICLWGEHNMSRWMSYNTGKDAIDFEHNLQKLYERTISGGNRNPANLPYMRRTGNEWGGAEPLSAFGGMATYIAERSTVQQIPFNTYFNIGSGERYNYKGKKAAGGWYNMSTQDVVPTYRWLVYNENTKTVSTAVQPSFSLNDSYMGGSSLLLTGQGSGNVDVVLYRTNLKLEGPAHVKVATKQMAGSDAKLFVILKKKGSTTFEEVPVPLTGNAWQEQKIQVGQLAANDEVEQIGLRLKDCSTTTKIYVGQLQLNDEKTLVAAKPENLKVDVKEETKKSLSVKLNWALPGETTDKVVSNDEKNVDHFEVLYRNGESGTAKVVSHVSSWAAYVGNIELEDGEEPWVGVRSVSKDLKTFSEPVWVKVPRADANRLPEFTPSYGKSQINQSSEGYATALKTRFINRLTTTGASVQNADYTYNRQMPYTAADSTNYRDERKVCVIKAKQGDVITVNYTYDQGSDNLKYCKLTVYADFDGDRIFNPAVDGEQVVYQGLDNKNSESEHKPFTFTIPTDAKKGASCLRFVFSDAWFAHPGPTGYTNKGYTVDFGLEIDGTNAERQAPADLHDAGTPEAPENLDSPTGIGNVSASGASHVTVTADGLSFTNVERAWIYSVDGKLVSYLRTVPAVFSTQGYVPGTYVVKMENANVLRTQKVMIK